MDWCGIDWYGTVNWFRDEGQARAWFDYSYTDTQGKFEARFLGYGEPGNIEIKEEK